MDIKGKPLFSIIGELLALYIGVALISSVAVLIGGFVTNIVQTQGGYIYLYYLIPAIVWYAIKHDKS